MTSVRTFYRKPSVRNAMGWANSTLYQKIKDGLFTPPVKLGPRASVWPSDELIAIQAAYVAGQPVEDIRNLVSSLVASRKGNKGAV